MTALAWLPAGPASALVSGSFQIAGSASSNPTSTNTCALSSGDASPSSTVKAVVGGKLKTSLNMNATFTSNTDTNDVTVVTGHYTGLVNARKSHGDLSLLTLTGSGTVSIQKAEGNASHCRTTADMVAQVEPMSFTESHPGWFLAHRAGTAKSQIVELEAVSSTGSGALVDLYEGDAGSADERAFVPPGSFDAVAVVATTAGGVVLKTANQTSLSLAFFQAGAAPSGASGSGKQFVRFPASVSCGTHSAKLTWTAKAGRVASGAFFVNGAKRATVSHPHAGDHVTLRHLSSTADTKIVGNLSISGGGHASVTRAYLPCKG